MIVATRNGKITGIVTRNAEQYLGIPYAKPPVGRLRFKPPEEADGWRDIRKCDHYGHAAPQLYVAGLTNLQKDETLDEDCLYLNVTTPKADHKKRPVLFWIHGGAFQKGSATLGIDPLAFAKEEVVVVNANYRLGALGFLDFTEYLGDDYVQSGNTGLLDIIQALTWTKDNIAAFGGDPGNITIMGQSAGAKLAATLTVMPKAKGLFHKAILCSGATQCIRDRHTARKVTELFMRDAGLTKMAANKLLTMSWQEILAGQKNLFAGLNLHTVGAVFDGINFPGDEALTIIREKAGNNVPVLLGTNRDEMNLYYYIYNFRRLDNDMAVRLFGDNAAIVMNDYAKLKFDETFHQNFIHLLTEYIYRAGVDQMAAACADAGEAVYLYRLDWDRQEYKACHASESQFLMGSCPIIKDIAASKAHELLAEQMHDSFIHFIKTGVPGAKNMIVWPKFTREDRRMLVFDDPCRIAVSPEPQVGKEMPHQVYILT